MKDQIEKLLIQLQPKGYGLRDNPIRIGNILEKITASFKKSRKDISCEMLVHWSKCGFTKSLQQIIKDSGWETGYIHDGIFRQSDCIVETERLKNPNARALIEYIIDLKL